MGGTILVVDDQPAARRVLAAELEDAGFRVLLAADGREGWEAFCQAAPDCVITDLVMPRSDGLDLLSRIRTRTEVPVIVFSAHGSMDTAVAALKGGAVDFVPCTDLDVEALVARVREAVAARERRAAPSEIAQRLLGESPAMVRVRERVEGLAPLLAPVLVRGERGTGRDTVVRALHELGASAAGKLAIVRAGDFSPGDRLPERGAVYLDEVHELSPEAQRFWADRLADAAERGWRPYPRFLASTLLDLTDLARTGAFDPRLADRLGRFAIELAPLRDRTDDIPQLAAGLLERFGGELGRVGLRISPEAVELLKEQPWPGNVADLATVIERTTAFTREREITRKIVSSVILDVQKTLASIRGASESREREALMAALLETGGNVTRAAERLGRSRQAIYRMIARHGIRLGPTR